MKSYTAAIIIGAITTQQSAAFQPSISRRALLSNIATTAGAAAVLVPTLASAAEPKAGKKELLRGGKNASDALHNGTDLNPKEGAVAASLMEKMGMAESDVQGSDPSRAPPKKR